MSFTEENGSERSSELPGRSRPANLRLGSADRFSVPRPTLTLYIRTYCHLCDDLRAAVLALHGQFDFDLEEVDVDDDDDLEARLGEKVPLLMHGEREICHYFFDETAFRQSLENEP